MSKVLFQMTAKQGILNISEIFTRRQDLALKPDFGINTMHQFPFSPQIRSQKQTVSDTSMVSSSYLTANKILCWCQEVKHVGCELLPM